MSLNNPHYVKRGQYIERRVMLFREVNSRVRYYSLHLCMTLFGEYLLVKENGSIKNKKSTRVVKEYYETLAQAMKSYRAKLLEKTNKGYVLDLIEISKMEPR